MGVSVCARHSDIVGVAIDLDELTIKYMKNGKDLGIAFELPSNMRGLGFFPAVTLKVGKVVQGTERLSGSACQV